ncbi:methyltransferase domain-containing protein [Aquisalimonas asiatica]|uniref:Thiopurine S-methyltransferase (TPMT) n=1 Tax=Aquisalimonas asiatica TaxID=406100 RepID=A0A1H8UVK1_9GAMM|nr:methyltransferase domain-containing protein [Aquisalimonas asiatica]SEP07215.1 Thiopurine S-methyltransferase (TPMT) [Aquisalimonas asiatica]
MATDQANYWHQRWLEGKTGWDRGDASPALRRWLDAGHMTPGRILVPGCGNGYEVDLLAAHGFSVTALDIVPEPLAALRERLAARGLTADVVEGDVFTYMHPDGPFDAVYEQTCLCAFDPALRPDYAERLRQWVRPGGTLYALFAQTPWRNGPPFHSSPEQMRALFTDADWIWPAEADFTVPHEAGFHELGYRLRRR